MALTISSFLNATSGKYAAAALNPKRKRLIRLLAKAGYAYDVTSAAANYFTTDATLKALVTDAALITTGMTQDQVDSGVIYVFQSNPSATVFPALTDAEKLSKIRLWEQLDDLTLNKMEMVLDAYSIGLS